MSSSTTTLAGVKAPHGAHAIELQWADGQAFSISHRVLRGYCPCAGCQGHTAGVRFADAGEPEIRDIRQVGNYAIELGWSDGHATGIYPYPFLRRLSELYAAHGDALPEKHAEL